MSSFRITFSLAMKNPSEKYRHVSRKNKMVVGWFEKTSMKWSETEKFVFSDRKALILSEKNSWEAK